MSTQLDDNAGLGSRNEIAGKGEMTRPATYITGLVAARKEPGRRQSKAGSRRLGCCDLQDRRTSMHEIRELAHASNQIDRCAPSRCSRRAIFKLEELYRFVVVRRPLWQYNSPAPIGIKHNGQVQHRQRSVHREVNLAVADVTVGGKHLPL